MHFRVLSTGVCVKWYMYGDQKIISGASPCFSLCLRQYIFVVCSCSSASVLPGNLLFLSPVLP